MTGCTGLPGSQVSQHVGVLFPEDGNLFDHGLALHPQLPFLLGTAGSPGTAGSRGACPSGRCRPPDGLKYVVVTSVTRDDVADGGASLFARTIIEIRRKMTDACVEVLIPDFQGNRDALHTVLKARPDVLNHNIETVPRLYPRVRPQAKYQRSLDIIRWAHEFDAADQVRTDAGSGRRRIRSRGYFGGSSNGGLPHPDPGPVSAAFEKPFAGQRFIPPEEFEAWRKKAIKIGFTEVASGPFVRSSYHAKELYQEVSA